MQVVFGGPLSAVVVLGPLLVDVEVGQMVAFGDQ